MSNIKINVGLNMGQQEVNKVLREIDKLKKALEINMDISNETQAKEALSQLNKLAISLKGSMNETFGKVNVQQFERNMKTANISMNTLERSIERAGEESEDLFNSFKYGATVISSSIKRQQTIVEKMSDTMIKTASWSMANRAFDLVANSVSQAVGYMKNLDESLTNISIVSDLSKNEMKDFAEYANKASQALGQTTVAYTEGALLYLQQGKTLAEAQQLTEATLVGANITGESTADIAELLTASLNGYNLAAKDAMDVTDKFAAVGAATGSDFNELATAFSKTASMASVAGVSFDQLAAQIATISTVTREAPESIGTSLKTIFGRMTEIKELGSDEEGTTYGKVEETLGRVGIAIADENDKLRDMGKVIEEVGESWELFDRNTQLAIANVMAGSRQANRLIALFENWGMYQDALTTSIDSSGSALQQQEKYLDSIEAKTNSLKAAMEGLFSEILSEDAYKGMLDSLTNIVNKATILVDSLGGVQGILTTLAPLWTSLASKFLINMSKDSLLGTLTGDPFKGFKANFSEINKIMAETPDKAKFAMEKLGIPADVIAEHEQLINKKGQLEDKVKASTAAIELEDKALKEQEAILSKMNADYLKAIKDQNTYQDSVDETAASIERLNKKIAENDFSGSRSEKTKKKGAAEEQVANLTVKLKEQNIVLEEAKKKRADLSREYSDMAYGAYQSEEAIRKHNMVVREAGAEYKKTKEQADNFSNALNKISKLQSIAKYASIAVSVGNSLISATKAMKTFGDAAASTEDKMNALTSVTSSLGMALMMIPNPVTQIIGAITMLAGPVIDLLENSFNSTKRLIEENEKVTTRYTEKVTGLTSEIESLESQNTQLIETQKEIIAVGGDLNNLTFEQREAYKELANEIANTTPEMVAYYDAEGNAILKANQNLDDYIQKKKESLELEQGLMLGNRDKFVEQYAIQASQGEKQLTAAQAELEAAKAELEAMEKRWGVTSGTIKKQEEVITKLETKITNLTSDLTNLDTNIQNNIIKPFMLSNEAINSTEDSLKQVVAAGYNIETVSALMTKYQTTWKMAGGQIKEVYRSTEEVVELVTNDLDKLEEKATNAAYALESIRGKAIGGSEENKEYAKIYNNLSNVNQVTQEYIGTMSQMGRTASETEAILTRLGSTIDKFGVAQNLTTAELLPITQEETSRRINEINDSLETSKQRLTELSEISDGMTEYSVVYDAATNRHVRVLNEEYKPTMEEIENLQTSIVDQEIEKNTLLKEQADIYQQIKQEQMFVNQAYGEYLLNLSQTTEGMNQIIDSYNAQYEKFAELNALMTESSSQTLSQPGGLGEEATEVEVETFKDSDLGEYFHDFSEYINDMIDDDFTGLEDAFKELRTYGEDAARDMTDRFAEMGKTLQDLPSGILDEFADMSDEMAGFVKDIQENGENASLEAIDAVQGAVNQQQQALGQMYATINKDNVGYFQEFKAQNMEQINLVGMATGIMGTDYATYAEYKASLDKWMADNSSWLADEEISNMYWAAAQGIIAKQNEANAVEGISGDMVDTYEMDNDTRVALAKAASWASALAEAKAAKERAQILRDSLANVDLGGLSGDLATAAQDVLNKRIAEAEVDLATYDEIIKTLEDKLSEEATAGAGITTKKPGNSFNYSAGAGSVPKKPTSGTSRPTITPSPTPSSDKGSGGKGGSGSESAQQDVEDLEYVEDLYHDINIEINKVTNSLKKLQEIEDDLYGEAKLQNMAQQAELLRKQRDLSAQKLAIAKQEAAQKKSELASEGVLFDSTGAITNYNEIIKAKTEWANSLTGDAKKEAQEYVKELQKAISEYETLHFKTILDYESELEDLREAIQDKILEAIQYEYELNVEASIKFQGDADFLNEFLEGIESVDDVFKRTLDTFVSQAKALEAFEKRYNDIINNSELDAEAKREAIEKLKEDFKDALLSLKDFYEAISEYIQDVIKKNADAIDEQLGKFEAINDELSDMINMYELLGKDKNIDAINQALGVQISSNEAQIDLLKKARDEMASFRDSLEEGTDEWKAANEEVEKMDEDIRKLALDTVKLLQEQLENTFNKTLSEVEKALSNGLGFDKLEKQIKKAREEQEKYYDNIEKSVWSARMLEKIQKDIAKQTDPKKQQLLQQFYNNEIKTLLEKDKLTADEVKRAELLYDLTLKQMAVEEARANKTIMRLVRDDQGNWVYQYMSDLEAIASAQDDLSSSIDDLMKHDQEVYEKTQDEILERRKQFIKDMKDLQEAYLNGEFESEEEFNKALAQLQEEFNSDMVILSQEYALAEENIAESTLMNIMDAYDITYGDLNNLTEEQKQMFEDMGITLGDSWDETLKNMTQANDNHTKAFIDAFNNEDSGVKAQIKDAFSEMSEAVSGFESKIDEVTTNSGLDFETMTGKVETLKDETGKLKAESEKLVAQMGLEFDAIKKNLPQYDKIKEAYEKITGSVKSYIDKINEAIKAQENLANAQKPEPPTPSTPSTSPTPSTPSTPNLGQGSSVRIKSGTRWYYDSAGKNPSGNAWTNRDLIITKQVNSGSHPYNVGTKAGEYLGWVKKTDFVGFKTGGYTGDWTKSGGMDGEGGKMALLHQKEMVLNAEDTRNMLKAVELVRDFASDLRVGLPSILNSGEGITNQNITIQADFSGVRNSNEIEDAFNNLVNQAYQYANQRK